MGIRKKKSGGNAIEVPMSSMIDVVFLLLIYFIVTYKDEISEAHLAVNLPMPNPIPQDGPPPVLLEIEIHPGEYLFRQRAMTPDRIEGLLRTMAANDPDLTVVIKTNQRARTGNLVRILDICQGVGLKNMSVVTLK